jgi:hypothetical protein
VGGRACHGRNPLGPVLARPVFGLFPRVNIHPANPIRLPSEARKAVAEGASFARFAVVR